MLRGFSELDELELELVLLEGTLSKLWALILSFLRRSFLLPHFLCVSFLPALGMAACTLKDLRLSQHGSMTIMMVKPSAGAPHKTYDDRRSFMVGPSAGPHHKIYDHQ